MTPLNLIPFIAGWAVVALIVLILAIYRRAVAGREDDSLHVLDSDAASVAEQGVLARKLEVIDRWGKILTVIALIYGLALAAGYVYLSWVERYQTSVQP